MEYLWATSGEHTVKSTVGAISNRLLNLNTKMNHKVHKVIHLPLRVTKQSSTFFIHGGDRGAWQDNTKIKQDWLNTMQRQISNHLCVLCGSSLCSLCFNFIFLLSEKTLDK